MLALTEIALSCRIPLTLPGHDALEHTGSSLYNFAMEMLQRGCNYGLQVAKGLPPERQPKIEAIFRALLQSTPRALIDSLERARKQACKE